VYSDIYRNVAATVLHTNPETRVSPQSSVLGRTWMSQHNHWCQLLYSVTQYLWVYLNHGTDYGQTDGRTAVGNQCISGPLQGHLTVY